MDEFDVLIIGFLLLCVLVFNYILYSDLEKNQNELFTNQQEIIRLLQPDIAIDSTVCEEKGLPGYGKGTK